LDTVVLEEARGFEVLQKEDIEKFGRKAAEKAVRLLMQLLHLQAKFPVIMDSRTYWSIYS